MRRTEDQARPGLRLALAGQRPEEAFCSTQQPLSLLRPRGHGGGG
ncbi:MAG: hypothetical protein NTY67_11900 [Cyanobacteria bacterium]|nr:hypothetical protein [Cyanobacteriota bacterium]